MADPTYEIQKGLDEAVEKVKREIDKLEYLLKKSREKPKVPRAD